MVGAATRAQERALSKENRIHSEGVGRRGPGRGTGGRGRGRRSVGQANMPFGGPPLSHRVCLGWEAERRAQLGKRYFPMAREVPYRSYLGYGRRGGEAGGDAMLLWGNWVF